MSVFPEAAKPAHIPVLLSEALEALSPKPGGRYLDGTVGLGGHAAALLERVDAMGGGAELCGLDRDVSALKLAARRLAPWKGRAHLFHARYSEFTAFLDELRWPELDGALLDIGVSSLQIDTPERGFSFRSDGPLDMRMDRDSPEVPVSRLVNSGSCEELRMIIARYGEDPLAARIARAIVEERAVRPLETTRDLAAVVEKVYPASWKAKSRNHPATRTFQALRMAVNDELGELERFMDAILGRLAVGGRLAVISFHSLEDRLIKHRMRDWARGCVCPPYLPVCVCGHQPEVKLLFAKPVQPGGKELASNPRAGSAKLRAVEKLSPSASTLSGDEQLKELEAAYRVAERVLSAGNGKCSGRFRRAGSSGSRTGRI